MLRLLNAVCCCLLLLSCLEEIQRLLEHLICELAEFQSRTPNLVQLKQDCIAAVKLYVELLQIVGVDCARPKILDNVHWVIDIGLFGCAEGFSAGMQHFIPCAGLAVAPLNTVGSCQQRE